MKKILLFLITFSLLSIYCYSQLRNTTESNLLKKELTDSIGKLRKQISALEYKLGVSDSVVKSNFKVLANSIGSTKKSIDDTRIRESLRSAESTLQIQNYWIESFGVIYSIITIVLAILPILLYFIQIRPLIQSARETSNSANQASRDANEVIRNANAEINSLQMRIQQFDQRIESQVDKKFEKSFKEYKETLKSDNIDTIIRDLTGLNSNAKNEAVYRLSTLPKDDFTQDQIFKLLDIIDNQYLSNDVEEGIIYFLTKKEVSDEA